MLFAIESDLFNFAIRGFISSEGYVFFLCKDVATILNLNPTAFARRYATYKLQDIVHSSISLPKGVGKYCVLDFQTTCKILAELGGQRDNTVAVTLSNLLQDRTTHCKLLNGWPKFHDILMRFDTWTTVQIIQKSEHYVEGEMKLNYFIDNFRGLMFEKLDWLLRDVGDYFPIYVEKPLNELDWDFAPPNVKIYYGNERFVYQLLESEKML